MKKRILTPEEKQLWEEVTRSDRRIPLRQVVAHHETARVMTAPIAYRSMQAPLPSSPTDPLYCGGYNGIDRNTANRFRKGDWEPEATLDLHGMTLEKALHALSNFLKTHYMQQRRHLLVITGKGRKTDNPDRIGVTLRESLPGWLDEPGLRPMILAFDIAKPKHGGSGAYYILLKRKR